MIYEPVDASEPIKQGNIFRDVPRIDVSLSELAVLDDDGTRSVSWADILAEADSQSGVAAVIPIRPVLGVVISQNCDATRGEFVALCQLEAFSRLVSPPTSPKKWKNLIIKHSRENLRYFYLPADAKFGLPERLAVDLRIPLRVRRVDLEGMRAKRLGRLNHVSAEHFRETLAQFFRRYPYDEWYPLTREEFEAYREESPEPVDPFPWQK